MNSRVEMRIEELSKKRNDLRSKLIKDFNELTRAQVIYMQEDILKIEKELKGLKGKV